MSSEAGAHTAFLCYRGGRKKNNAKRKERLKTLW